MVSQNVMWGEGEPKKLKNSNSQEKHNVVPKLAASVKLTGGYVNMWLKNEMRDCPSLEQSFKWKSWKSPESLKPASAGAD